MYVTLIKNHHVQIQKRRGFRHGGHGFQTTEEKRALSGKDRSCVPAKAEVLSDGKGCFQGRVGVDGLFTQTIGKGNEHREVFQRGPESGQCPYRPGRVLLSAAGHQARICFRDREPGLVRENASGEGGRQDKYLLPIPECTSCGGTFCRKQHIVRCRDCGMAVPVRVVLEEGGKVAHYH